VQGRGSGGRQELALHQPYSRQLVSLILKEPAVVSLHNQLRKQNELSRLEQVRPMLELLRDYGLLGPRLIESPPYS